MNYQYPQQVFPMPQGSLFLINNSNELQNIPSTQGVNAILCISENKLYLKSLQNGSPSLLVYDVTQQDAQKNDYDARIKYIENELKKLKGGNDELLKSF